MIITIASGKGGTGKTTVSTSLAVSSGRKILLADCDVEVPNAHIFFKKTPDETEELHLFVPEIDYSKCTGCKECERVCRYNAIAVVGKKPVVFQNLCHSCKGCFYICPEKAVSHGEKLLGVVEKTNVDDKIKLVTGKIKTGEMASPRLIARVKEYIEPEVTAIIDSPPGTSCPAIEAMKGSDYIVLVTEPTPFGLSDLKLAVETVRLLEIPCGIIVNKHVEENQIIHEYAKSENIEILMEIPFSRDLAENYSKGNLIVEGRPDLKEEFKITLEKILNRAQLKGAR